MNAGRLTDLQAALSGLTGSYAYPGGNQPSVHFNVQNEVGEKGSVAVIRFESIQDGHPLNGAIFDEKVFLPCFYVTKFGPRFQSCFEDRIGKATQELICHYFAKVLCGPTLTAPEEVPQKEVNVNIDASDYLGDAFDGVPGFYRYTSDAGEVVLEVFATKYPVVKIAQSTMEGIPSSKIFLPLHVAMGETLSTGGLPEEVSKQQLVIFDLLKDAIADHKAHIVINAPAPAVKPKAKGAKELAKAGVKRAKKIAVANAVDDKATALASMRKSAITPLSAINGKLGFVEMGNLSGELIVQFGMIGNDRVVEVAYMSENHMLKLAGVSVGSKVYGGQVLNGLIDRIDAQNLHMDQKAVKCGNALIGYVREFFANNGIRMSRKAPDLKKVA